MKIGLLGAYGHKNLGDEAMTFSKNKYYDIKLFGTAKRFKMDNFILEEKSSYEEINNRISLMLNFNNEYREMICHYLLKLKKMHKNQWEYILSMVEKRDLDFIKRGTKNE